MRVPSILLSVAVALTAACGGAGEARVVVSAAPGDSAYPAPPALDAGHYGIGRTPSRAEVTAWNTDIGPEGTELPPGKGSVREGETLYRTHCAACHGVNGEGLAVYPALIGRDPRGEDFGFAADPSIPRTIGNYWSHATTLYDYIRRAMPLFTPGVLSADETYAVTAYLLAANRVIPDSTVLDAAALRAVEMPARNRFVPDDRSPSR